MKVLVEPAFRAQQKARMLQLVTKIVSFVTLLVGLFVLICCNIKNKIICAHGIVLSGAGPSGRLWEVMGTKQGQQLQGFRRGPGLELARNAHGRRQPS